MKSNLTPNLTPIASAVAVLVMSVAMSAQAQQAAPQVQEVAVTGVRAALEKSLAQKRNADSVVEVVTAEDIGKMPDKNVADAISRLPGVNTQSSAGGEGGFGENDRVSLRGTSPSLQQTLFNGHAISTGDWFVLNQIGGNVGRSSSFSLLPSEVVSSVVVKKSATADLVEGGVSGAIDVITRRPLDFKKQVTVEAAVQANYNDLSKKAEPNFSGLINWKNDAKTVGILVQAFSEKSTVRRDGQEILGYAPISANSSLGISNPALVGVRAPTFIGDTFFEQTKTRTGGAFDVEIKPNKNVTLDFNGFYSKLEAPNQNTNTLAAIANPINSTNDAGVPNGPVPTGLVVRNNTLVAGNFAKNGGEVDTAYRPGAAGEAWYLDFNGKVKVTSDLTLSGRVGTTYGRGSNEKEVFYQNNMDGGMNFALNGLSPATVSYPGGTNSKPLSKDTTGWSGGGDSQSVDKEKYAQVDADLKLNAGMLESVKFGARFTDHERTAEHPFATRPNSLAWGNPGPVWAGTMYPSNFGSGLGGAVSNQHFTYDGAALVAWAAVNNMTDRVLRHSWTDEFKVNEKTSALYAMGNLAGEQWSGNFGLRAVQTKQSSLVNFAGGANPIVGSAWGPYSQVAIDRTYNDYLPSANFRFDVRPDLVVRAAAAKTMARPDYSALGGSVSLNDDALSGSGGNANLNPVRSNNFDLSTEWYFAPKSAFSVGLFYMDMTSIVSQGTANATYLNVKTGQNAVYQVTSPFNTTGTNSGAEFSLQLPLWSDFGVLANYTYADGKLADCKGAGCAEMINSSKNTYNLTGFYENAGFSARLAYNYRSAYKAGVDRGASQHVDASGNLAGSLSYELNKNLTLTFDALNLTNTTIKMYADNVDQPRAFYSNGRTFYLGLRVKM
jgi:iron complex outermembrane receptor protein